MNEDVAAGSTLGHFTILERIGAGAGGVVYRARDARLGREVALKVLPGDLARNAERLVKFQQEARALAGVNHPSVAAIHGIEEDRGTHYLVLELVSGETLAERLAAGPWTTAAALDAARQIAAALDAAHARGIIHRDLKPANVKITPEGRIKVLDFGLAVMTRPAAPDAGASVTLEMPDYAPGTIVGTPVYLCPEQARGEEVDARSDLWALGCVLYELLTGAPPFAGGTILEVLAAVLERHPDLDRLPADLPAAARDLIRSCLEKERGRRPESAAAVVRILDAAQTALAGTVPVWRPATLRLTQVTFATGIEASPVWSPDGKELCFTREAGEVRHLFRQPASGGNAAPVTRGNHDEIMPAWSPDGGTVLFVRARQAGQRLEPGDVFGRYDTPADVWALDLATGREEKLLDRAYHPSFSPDGRRIAVDATWAGPSRLWIVDRNGRNPRQITSDVSEAVEHIRPRWSPGGEHLVFQNIERTKLDVRVVRLRDGAMTWVTNDLFKDLDPVWTPDGRAIVFSSAYRAGGVNLWRVPVSPEGSPLGPPVAVTTGAGQDVEPAFSSDGARLAFAVLRQNADVWRLPVDPATGRAAGRPARLIGGTREESRGAWSPDGTRVAFNSDRAGDMNLWIHVLADGSERQLTRGPGGDYQADWSPDQRSLAFFSGRAGHMDIWTVDVERGTLQPLTRGDSLDVNPFYSPDGSRIAFHSDRDGRLEVWIMNADGSEPRQLTRVGVGGHFLRWTPDGRHVLFTCPGLKRIMRVPSAGGEPEPFPEIQGGSHISLSPDASRVMDVVTHKVLWVSPLDGTPPDIVFEFPEPEARIDYPSWSPDGRWVLFDRFQPQGGDIWVGEPG